MNWQKFIEINKIGKIFHNVSIENVVEHNPFHKEVIFSFIHDPFSLIMYGLPGRGKTYATLAIIKKMIEKENPYNIRFIKAKTIDDTVMEMSYENKSSTNFIRILEESKYLFIDDFGIDKATQRVVNDLYRIIDYRLENDLATIISTNLKKDEITTHYGERIGSRLETYKKLFFGGKDLRLPKI